ncbi:MAG: hypothetical protein J7647_19575 [Cyanobacteria bacterium SBLK]|nr:hypothetical protein [Cyanobacteria bacterium SBLK]
MFSIALGILLFAKPAFAALPPLSQEELAAQTNCIVIGTVNHISDREIEVELGTDIYYTATVAIETIEKPSPTYELKVGAEIKVNYWQIGERPLGWTGPGGQYAHLHLNQKYRLFLIGASEDNFALLEPNGCERID